MLNRSRRVKVLLTPAQATAIVTLAEDAMRLYPHKRTPTAERAVVKIGAAIVSGGHLKPAEEVPADA